MSEHTPLKSTRFHMDSRPPEGYAQVIGNLAKIWRKVRTLGITKKQVRSEFQRRSSCVTRGASDEAQRCFQDWGILHQSSAGASFFLFDEARAEEIVSLINEGRTPLRQTPVELEQARARLQAEFDTRQSRAAEMVDEGGDRSIEVEYAALEQDLRELAQALQEYERGMPG